MVDDRIKKYFLWGILKLQPENTIKEISGNDIIFNEHQRRLIVDTTFSKQDIIRIFLQEEGSSKLCLFSQIIHHNEDKRLNWIFSQIFMISFFCIWRYWGFKWGREGFVYDWSF